MKSILLALCLSLSAQALIPAPQEMREQFTEAKMPAVSGAYILRGDKGVYRYEAFDAAGEFYAQQSMKQLQAKGVQHEKLEIVDAPRFAWRGLHLDVSRHFMTVAEVKDFIDRMAALKFNRLHFHLTDGPGWRLEMKKYPRLTQVGAWRESRIGQPWDWRSTRMGGELKKPYGGFYTQDEMRELIAYAAERHVMIMPEIDLPGHSYATIICYPELGSPEFEALGNGLRGNDVLDMSNPATLEFAKDVCDELMAIFPEGTPIHIGGDEVPNAGEQQRVWMQPLVEYLRSKGREVYCWDEAAAIGVKDIAVTLWRDDQVEPVIEKGIPLVLCHTSHFYFDFPQSDAPGEPEAMGTELIRLKDVFSYRPVEHELVLGLQANLWTEYMQSYAHVLYMCYPRAAAVAERAWGSPERSFESFEADCKQLNLVAPKPTPLPVE